MNVLIFFGLITISFLVYAINNIIKWRFFLKTIKAQNKRLNILIDNCIINE